MGVTELSVSSSSHLPEHQLRNKLNQDQSARLQQQRDGLSRRNLEVASMDRRLAELRQRLRKKKAALQQKENLPVSLSLGREEFYFLVQFGLNWFLCPAGGAGRRRPSAGLQGGGGGAVHAVVLHDRLPGASGAGPPRCDGEVYLPGRHRHPAHARLGPEAASPSSETSFRYVSLQDEWMI